MTPRNLTTTETKRLQRVWRKRTEHPLGLLLDSVQTPFNVGAILRTAAAFRVAHIWLAGASATPDHAKTGKTSLGTERFVPWSSVANVPDAVRLARQQEMRVIGIEMTTDASPLAEIDFDRPVCLVFGNEDRGLSKPALEACDEFAFVPTPGKVGSLNVAAAAAIAIYESRRQQWGSPQ